MFAWIYTNRPRFSVPSSRKTEGAKNQRVRKSNRPFQLGKDVLSLGTGNVRSTNQGKFEIVKNDVTRNTIDILGISELRWTGKGQLKTEDTMFYSGHGDTGRNGVAVHRNKQTAENFLGYNPISHRIIPIRIQAKPDIISIIQVYWPTGAVSTKKKLPAADCGTDHELLATKVRLKMGKNKASKREPRFDISSIPLEYRVVLSNRFAALQDPLEGEVDAQWTSLKNIILSEAEKYIPKTKEAQEVPLAHRGRHQNC